MIWELELMPKSPLKSVCLLLSDRALPSASWVDTAEASPVMMREDKEEVCGDSSQVCPEEVLKARSVVDLSSSGLH